MDNQQPSLNQFAVNKPCRFTKGTPGYYDREVRTCVKCGITKPLNLFVKCKQNASGRTTACKECRAKDSAKRYHRKPLKERVRHPGVHAARKKRDQEAVFNHYGRTCECCGESHLKFLTVDHIEKIGTKKREKEGQTNIYRFLVRRGMPSGFRILCFNCNCGRDRNGGICPHQEGSQAISKESSDKRREVPGALNSQGCDMVEPGLKNPADPTFHDNASWPFSSDRVQ